MPPSKSSSQKKKEIEDDPSVIVASAKTIGLKCGNPQCYTRAIDVTLKACARCKSIRYCSRDCQSAHWKTHKVWCNYYIQLAEELAKADAEGGDYGLPPGLTLLELDQTLEKWVKLYNNLLTAATIHALSLPKDIKRARSYLLRVKISYRPDNNGVLAKTFRVDDAVLIDMDAGRALGGVWPESISQIQKMREESESLKRGTVAAVALECEPLAMQLVPFGSLRDLSPLTIQQRWKEILIKNVENGTKFTRFEMDDTSS
ncbi:hypothetical protein GALMADRAFT_241879 [Galerina marginata CBS 339.88]|uniref:MYND-type domain-containing protein n=1 Tax=Galerina marginata (strain CBS 339.88) TaxID=685588 RepID=A0A067TLE8_GALM3|nr:hypothetical protein GALMADRAFT_241879 [Galerina marginata CBS 339.88]